MMLLRAILILLLLVPAMAQADLPMRQLQAQTPVDASKVAARLQAELPPSVVRGFDASGATFSYTGLHTPAPLVAFVLRTFADVDAEVLTPPNPVSITLSLRPADDGTQVVALIKAAFPTDDLHLPPGATVVLDGRTQAACSGQLVVSQHAAPQAASRIYKDHLIAQGFTLDEIPLQGASYFSGYRPGCTAIAYIQPNTPASSLVVLRFLED